MPVLRLTDPDAVRQAIANCDEIGREAFEKRYGRSRSSRYKLNHQDVHYDPTPIVAAALEIQDGEAPTEVKGAPGVLQALGFTIVDLTPPWHEDEMVLALQVYLDHRGQRLGKRHPAVVTLSDRLRTLVSLRGGTVVARSRNRAGVEQQIGKFLSLDPQTPREGRGTPSTLHLTTWERYAHEPRALARRVAEILNELEAVAPRSITDPIDSPPSPSDARPATTEDRATPRRPPRSLDELLAPFADRPPSGPITAPAPVDVDSTKHDRAREIHEALRVELAQRLRSRGYEVRQGLVDRDDELDVDLIVRVGSVVWIVEVKSLPESGRDGEQLRKGLGQVLWYRGAWRERYGTYPCLAVLFVERCPSRRRTWQRVCYDAGVVLGWPDHFDAMLATLSERTADLGARG